jgi:hypothetical protein
MALRQRPVVGSVRRPDQGGRVVSGFGSCSRAFAVGYWEGWTTALPSMVTAVCASSLPLIDAPVRSVAAV